jgi:hypothetical protein
MGYDVAVDKAVGSTKLATSYSVVGLFGGAVIYFLRMGVSSEEA